MVIRFSEAGDQPSFFQTVGFAEIAERLGMISQFGVHQSDKEMRVHRGKGFQIHVRDFDKRESG